MSYEYNKTVSTTQQTSISSTFNNPKTQVHKRLTPHLRGQFFTHIQFNPTTFSHNSSTDSTRPPLTYIKLTPNRIFHTPLLLPHLQTKLPTCSHPFSLPPTALPREVACPANTACNRSIQTVMFQPQLSHISCQNERLTLFNAYRSVNSSISSKILPSPIKNLQRPVIRDIHKMIPTLISFDKVTFFFPHAIYISMTGIILTVAVVK